MNRADSVGIVIYGAGGHGREVAWLVEDIQRSVGGVHVACFADDDISVRSLKGIPVLSLDEARSRFPSALINIAVGDCALRQRLAARAETCGFAAASLIHPSVQSSRWNVLGVGVTVCAGSIITADVRLGRHAQINVGCTISHDVTAGDYLTLAPGVHVSGVVTFGRRVQVGTGASFINGTPDSPLVVGDDAVIGAGACVIRDVPPGSTVVGVPARPIRRG